MERLWLRGSFLPVFSEADIMEEEHGQERLLTAWQPGSRLSAREALGTRASMLTCFFQLAQSPCPHLLLAMPSDYESICGFRR